MKAEGESTEKASTKGRGTEKLGPKAPSAFSPRGLDLTARSLRLGYKLKAATFTNNSPFTPLFSLSR